MFKLSSLQVGEEVERALARLAPNKLGPRCYTDLFSEQSALVIFSVTEFAPLNQEPI